MIKLSIGTQTYRVVYTKGTRHIATIVRPLPPRKPSGRLDWRVEHNKLHEEIKQRATEYGIAYTYDPFFSLPNTASQGKCLALISKFHPYIDTLSESEYEPVEGRLSLKNKWGAIAFLQEHKHTPITDHPSRFKFIGTVPFAQIPEAQFVYNRLERQDLTPEQRELKVYQCTCGRNIVLPHNESVPTRDYGSCGCLAFYDVYNTRRHRQIQLDALREWSTMVLACCDERSVYYHSDNQFEIPSFPEFFKWYQQQVDGSGVTHRFVARKDPSGPFTIKNLKIVDRLVDRVPLYSYTIL